MVKSYIRKSVVALLVGSMAGVAAADGVDPNSSAAKPDAGVQMSIPLTTWGVDTSARASTGKISAKAATDKATIYRPLTTCRLVDTRGFAAAIAVAGPVAPNTARNINSAGFCGIPNNGYIAGLSLSFHVFNYTVNNGGYIAFQQQGAAITGTNAVFNPGAQWTAATTNVSIINDSGNFSFYVANSQVEVIIDVNGYYQDLNNVDIGTQEEDLVGTTAGNMLELTNTSSTGTSLAINSNGVGLRINSGKVAASGAGVGSSNFVTVHQVNTAGSFGGAGSLCAGFPAYSVIGHPQLNNNPGALVLAQPVEYYNGEGGHFGNYPIVMYYAGVGVCSSDGIGHWVVRRADLTAHLNAMQYTLMIIQP